MPADSALEVALRLAQSFDELGIDYLVGGSLASSLYGEPRSTQDVDLVADLSEQVAPDWLASLGDEFYVDPERLRQAIRKRRSFNVIHLATAFKADVFVLSPGPVGELEMARRRSYELGEGRSLQVASAEDVVLQKLAWYRRGGEVSDRQWRDVMAVLRVTGAGLDRDYLRRVSGLLGVQDLLARALTEAGL